MPNEREEIFVNRPGLKALEGPSTDIPKDETRQQRRARLASVLERGIVNDILNVRNLPDNLYGEWVRADAMQIDGMRQLGFRIDTEYATKRSVHSDGSSGNIVGDVIFMVCEKEVKEDIDYIRSEQLKRRDSKRAENEFQRQTDADTGGEIPTFIESRERHINRNELAESLSSITKQTSPG